MSKKSNPTYHAANCRCGRCSNRMTLRREAKPRLHPILWAFVTAIIVWGLIGTGVWLAVRSLA